MSAGARIGLTLLGVLAMGALFGMCGRVSDRGRFALSYSTYGAGPEGARGLYELTRASGFEPRRWSEDVAELPAPATLVALGGCDHLQARPLSRPEREALVRWVEAGGTWIVAGATEVLEEGELGVRLTPLDAERCAEDDGLYGMILRADRRARERERAAREAARDAGPADTASAPVEPAEPPEDPVAALANTLAGTEQVDREWAVSLDGPLAAMPAVGLRHPGRIQVDAGVEHEVLASNDRGPMVVVLPRGEGHIVVVAAGSAFQNRDLVVAEGAPLFVRLLRLYARGPVLFDEYHLGAGEARSTMRYLFQRGAGAIVLHLLVILAIVLLRGGVRFGAPRRDREVAQVTTASFVSAIGALFAKVRDPRGSFQILARRAYARIAEHHHVDELDPARLEQALRERNRATAADAVRDLAALARDGKSESLAHATRTLDDLVHRAVSDGV